VLPAVLTLTDLTGRQLARAVVRTDAWRTLDVPGPGTYLLIGAADAHLPEAAEVVVGDAPARATLLLDRTAELTKR